MQEFQTTICQIAVFMICAQMITHFRPKESYGKYMRMLLSVMILVQIFQPFCKLFFGMTGEELYAVVEEFQVELNQSMEAAAQQSALAEKKLENMSLLELQENIQKQQEMSQGQQENIQEQDKLQEYQENAQEQEEAGKKVETVQIDVKISKE